MKQASIPLALIVLLLLSSIALADTEPDASKAAQSYKISWWTVDGGGATDSHGGGYTMDGIIGQPDAGGLAGGGYAMGGGFWVGGEAAGYSIHLPLVLRSH